MADTLAELSITEAVRRLAAKEISSLDLIHACRENVEKRNTSINAYLEVFEDIEEQAAAADDKRAKGEIGSLLGIPLAIKDNILIEGQKVSAGSRILENYTAAYDATVTKKLKDAGAVFMGRTNMDEFAMGGSTENSAFGVTKNPLDETRVAGGSSGGSAAAVAAHMALGSLGSDTGGSIREPAAFCGLVGLKPTYGAVSRSGLIAMGSSLDQIGPFARTVADAELIFNAIQGKDEFDSTSIEIPTGVKEIKRIGVPRHLFEGLDKEVHICFESSLKFLREQGIEIVDIELPSASQALAMYYIIMPAEASTNLARFDGVRYGLALKGNSLVDDYAKTRGEGFGPEVRRRIMLGTYVLSAGYWDAYYGKATVARAHLRREVEGVLKEVDLIVTPTAPSVATKIGEKSDPLSMYLLDIFTVIANLTGHPALSVPHGSIEMGGINLPLGIQFMAPYGGEPLLFAAGKKLLP